MHLPLFSKVCRDLFKGTSLTSITLTGHLVKPTTEKNHGYSVEVKGNPWIFSLKDKTEGKQNHQNFAAGLARSQVHGVGFKACSC